MKKTFIHILYALLVVTPVISFAAFDAIKNLLRDVQRLLNLVIPIVFALALIFFFWGIGQFILNAGETKALEAGKQKMIWGIVGLFVMISIYGIIKYIGDSLGIQTPVKGTTTTECVFDEMGNQTCL